MLSDRGRKIKSELVKSFLISGRTESVPSNEILETQTMLIDADLNPNIEIKHLETLFKISRVKTWHPALTELERAFKSKDFYKVFPKKEFISSNLVKSLPISEVDNEKFANNRKELFDFWKNKGWEE
tara:strand:+ start:1361 stop:1741 length:381 start_codon:yes stop_codon:yes gene_type:complete